MSLSPVISNKLSNYLLSKNLQFGYNKNLQLCICSFCVTTDAVDYFIKRGSNVYLSGLDGGKAFDRVNHNILRKKLVARHAPQCLINIIKN